MLSVVGRRVAHSLRRVVDVAVHAPLYSNSSRHAAGLFSKPIQMLFSTQSLVDTYRRAADILDDPLTADDEAARATAVGMIAAAAKAGVPAAVGRVGRWHLFGLCDHARDVRKAVDLLHQAAAANDVIAQFWLGSFYLNANQYLPSEESPSAQKPAHGATETVEEEASRIARGKQVIASIRKLRKIAMQNKARKVQGLPLLPMIETAAAAEASDDTVPLRQDDELAYKWLLRAAEQDSSDAQVALGNLCMSREDYRQGIMWYEVAAQVAHHSLPSSIASSQSSTDADAPSSEGADDSSSEPAALNPGMAADPNRSGSPPHTDALYNLGMVYYDGIVDVVPRDRKRAAQYFRSAAALHDASALFWLGVSHHTGDAESGIWRNRHECLRYLELAAGHGHSGAQHYLSRIFRAGDNGIKVPADKRKADYFLLLAAEQGHPDALFEVGDAHYHGVDMSADLPKALELFLKAAEAGHVDAMISAGAMYFNGKGVAQDYHRAFELYQAAAEQGSIPAWENVAAMHVLGQGVPKNPEAASYIHKTIIPALTKAAESAGIQPEATLLDLEGDAGANNSGCGKPTCACKAGASPTDGCA